MPFRKKQIYPLVFAASCVLATALSPRAEAKLDDNGNGMSDVWEEIFGWGLVPGADSDGDGFSNAEEASAGTDPGDPLSRPESPELSVDADGLIHKSWPTKAGVFYQPWVSSDLVSWRAVNTAIVGTGEIVEVAIDPAMTFVAGGVDWRKWVGLTDWGLSAFKSLVAAGTPPDQEGRISSLSFARTDPDEDDYGQWITGWIVPPVSGTYTFWIAGDDHCEFRLATNPENQSTSPVASVPSWTSPGEWMKYPEQQSSPINLQAGESYYFEVFHREYGGGDHMEVAWTLPGEDPGVRETIGGPALSPTGESVESLRSEGGQLFVRLEILEVDSDGDGLTDYEESILGMDPADATSTPRVDDVEQARAAISSESVLTVGVETNRGYESDGSPVVFRIFRAGGIEPLSVQLSFSGEAVEGSDYDNPGSTVVFAPGQREKTVAVTPIPDDVPEPGETLTINLLSGSGFSVGSPASANATFDDARDEIFIAKLRPESGSPSTAFGRVVLRSAGNGLSGELLLEYSGLQSGPTAAELYFSTTGTSGLTWLTLPEGQVSGLTWDFAAEDGTPNEEVLAAIDAGNVWVRIRTHTLPEGELFGRLASTPAGQTMVTPEDTPVAPTIPDGAADAARFLAQATFGPTVGAANSLASSDFPTWVDTQMALPATYHHPDFVTRRDELIARDGNDGFQRPRGEVWWQHALTAPDQLRQRMAFALSQIFVISQIGGLSGAHEGTTLYYDMLLEHAFGNYRDLLEEVTLSPMMGSYLSMIRNRKPDPETGHEPDENYAREVMQLFSIGLNRMHLDGTLMLDENGMPIPTYDQEDIVGLAHIFTGWGPHYDSGDPPLWGGGNVADPDPWFLYGRDELRPMSFNANFHDHEDRTIVGDTLISGTLTGPERMGAALDTLFNHPNVAPFVAKHLIQKFVTANPSPGYVFRVASVFENNGSGVRGDLGATLRATLLDYEARSSSVADSESFGKGLEPIFRMTRMLRMLPPDAPKAVEGDDRYFLNMQYSLPEQGPLFSPSVFNFFEPGYASPGAISDAGLVSPEFQILSETTAIRQANQHFSYLSYGFWTPEEDEAGNNYFLRYDFTPLVEILNNPDRTATEAQEDLIDYLDTYLLFGGMSAELRADIQAFFASLPAWFDYSDDRQRSRAEVAVYLIFTSPEFFVFR